MLKKKDASLVTLALIAAFATANSPAASLTTAFLLAQSPTPTSFPLPTTVEAGTTVRVDGSPSMTVINESLKRRFEERYADTTVELANGGTDEALQALIDDELDLAAIGRPLTPEEKEQDLVEYPISREKIAIIVGSDNPFTGNLTFTQFAQMFRGEIQDWSEVGGTPGSIRFVDRPATSDTRQAFRNYPVFQAAPFETGDNAETVAADDTAAVIEALGSDGIGYATYSQVENQPNIRIVSMHQTLPDNPAYPFSQPRGYVYKNAATLAAPVLAFLGFAAAPAGQEAIAEAVEAESAAVGASPDAVAEPPATPIESPVTSPTPTETAAATEAERSGFPWWWLLLLPLLGLLWWALGRRRGEVPAVATAPPIAPTPVDPAPTVAADAGLASRAGSVITSDRASIPDGRVLPVEPLAPIDPVLPVVPPAPAMADMSDIALGGILTAGAGAAALPFLAALYDDRSRITLEPREGQQGYAYWHASDDHKADIRRQGGNQFGLRLYDVTDIDPTATVPHSIQAFELNEHDQDRPLFDLEGDRDYLAEIGYSGENGQWLPMARSNTIRLPVESFSAATTKIESPEVFSAQSVNGDFLAELPTTEPTSFDLGNAALAAGVGAVALPLFLGWRDDRSRITLEPREGQQGYAQWNAPDDHKADVRQQGGKHFGLRLYDATGIDPTVDTPESVQFFDLHEADQNLQLPIADTERDYLAEIGYSDETGQWLPMARSNTIRFPRVELPAVESVESAAIDPLMAMALPDVALEDVALESVPSVPDEPTLPLETAQPLLEDSIMTEVELEPLPATPVLEPPTVEVEQPPVIEAPIDSFEQGELGLGAVGLGELGLGGALAGLPFLVALSDDRSRITLEPREGQQSYAYWHVSEDHKADVRRQGGRQFGLRLYDVTDIDITIDSPYSVQFFDLEESIQDLQLPIADLNRDYLAEIGYTDGAGQWLPMARSNTIRLPLVEEAPSVERMAGRAALAMGAIATGFIPAEQIQSDVEATKFDLGQTDLSAEALAAVDSDLPELPEGYGESRIVLMPRDPQWAYAYWDVPNDHREALRRQGGSRLALRFYDVTDLDFNYQTPHSLQQYDCEEMTRDWYLPVPVSDRDYIAEIGYLTEDGRWLLLARSNPAHFPPVYPSDWFDDQFITMGWDERLRDRTVLGLIPPSQRQSFDNAIYDRIFGMAQSTEALRVAGSLFGSMQQVPQTAPSSYVFPSGGVGMGMVPMASGIGMSGIGMSGIGFAASMPPIRSRKFWLVADAELIVYGATEPDATVTIAGRPVPLNPDGTFRFQLSFQDGTLSYPIVAVAADGEQTRSIRLEFERETPERHTNSKDEAIDEWFAQ